MKMKLFSLLLVLVLAIGVTALNANGETRMQALRRKDEATGLWWKTKCKR